MSSIIIMHGAEFYLPLVYIGDVLKYKNCVSDFDWMSFHTFPVFFNKFTKKMSLWKNAIIKSSWELLSSRIVLFD